MPNKISKYFSSYKAPEENKTQTDIFPLLKTFLVVSQYLYKESYKIYTCKTQKENTAQK